MHVLQEQRQREQQAELADADERGAALPRRKPGMRNSARSSTTGRPAEARARSTISRAPSASTATASATGTGEITDCGQANDPIENGRTSHHQPYRWPSISANTIEAAGPRR